MFMTRRRKFQIFGKRKEDYHDSYLDSDSSTSSDDLLYHDLDLDTDSHDGFFSTKTSPKRRRCCGLSVYTPNTSRFSDHLHSRILQKFPFLIEMFYWIITYLFYRMTKVLSQRIFTTSIIEVSQAHGLSVLEFEQFSWASILFPWKEHEVQQWFMDGHQEALTVLNRAYALIHIPGTVGYVILSCFTLSFILTRMAVLASSHGTITSHPLTSLSPLSAAHSPSPTSSPSLPSLYTLACHPDSSHPSTAS